VETPRPLLLLLGAGPDAPGVREVLALAAARREAGGEVRVLLVHEGLAWAGERGLERRLPGATLGVCSRDARDRGWTLEQAPSGVAWSSVTSALGALGGGDELWAVLP
jgi:hypothetical protein